MIADPVPRTREAVVSELVEFAGLGRAEAETRVRQEEESLGWNVSRDVERFGVTAHVFDDRMAELYREGDGFIIETLVFWTGPERQAWTERAFERLRRYADRRRRRLGDLRVLMLGDGCGNDSLFLAARGFRVDYFDVPGSRTSAFARRRFEARPSVSGAIRVVADYASLLAAEYDAVLSFELLEHLPDPPQAIADMARMLRIGGIALVTEAFGALLSWLPTHLRANEQYHGRTAFLFLERGMRLTWYARARGDRHRRFKPIEFERVDQPSLADRARLVADFWVMERWLSGCKRKLRRWARGQKPR